MPKLIIENGGTFEIADGKRLVLALTDEARVDQLHACGGNGKCTTCKIEFISGEPTTMTEVEKNLLVAKGLTGVRLSCQMMCNHDMTVKIISRMEGSGRASPGNRPTDEIAPPANWIV